MGSPSSALSSVLLPTLGRPSERHAGPDARVGGRASAHAWGAAVLACGGCVGPADLGSSVRAALRPAPPLCRRADPQQQRPCPTKRASASSPPPKPTPRRARSRPTRAARPRAARPVEALGPARRSRRSCPAAPLLRAAPADEERPLGPVRAERRRPVAAHRAQPLQREQPRARRRGQLAAAPERPRAPAAAVLVDRPRASSSSACTSGPGRLPLALWGLLGVLATYAFVARLFDRRTGAYAAVVALDDAALLRPGAHDARRHLHDGGPRDGVRRPRRRGVRPGRRRARRPSARALPWLVMAAAGLFVGYESRGGLLGLARAAARRRPRRGRRRASAAPDAATDVVGDVVGAVVARRRASRVAAMAATVIAAPGDTKDLNMWIGAMLHVAVEVPDVRLLHRGHRPRAGAVERVPAVRVRAPASRAARAARAPTARAREPGARRGRSSARRWRFVAHGYLAARGRTSWPSAAPALCAVACAVAIRDFERGAHASIAVGLGTLVLAAVLHHDFHELPEKAYQAFGVTGATFPESFKDKALDLWWVVLGGFAVCAFLTWIERDAKRDAVRSGDVREGPAHAARGLRRHARARLLRDRRGRVARGPLRLHRACRTHAHWLPQMSSSIRDVVLNAWWVVAFVPLGFIFGLLFACDVWLWAFGRSRPLSKASLTRGFEPFEELFAPAAARATEEPTRSASRYDWWVVPLVVLAPVHAARDPGRGVRRACYGFGRSSYVAAAAGRALGRGVLPGDGLRRRRAAPPGAGAGARRSGRRLRPLLLLLPGARQPAVAQGGLRELPPGLPGRAARPARRGRPDGGVLRRRPAADAQRPDERVQLAHAGRPASAAASR